MIEEILGKVRIADRLTASRFARTEDVCNILSVGEHDPTSWGGQGRREWFPLSDSFQICPQDYRRAVDALQESWRENLHVIVCCHAGESRSSAMLVGWLMLHHREAVAKIQSKLIDIRDLPELFRETHRWVYDETKCQEAPESLLGSTLFQSIWCCYRYLATEYPRVIINKGLWRKLIESGVFDSPKISTM